MKRTIKNIICAILITTSLFPIVAQAIYESNTSADAEIIYLKNGCYITVEITTDMQRASGTRKGNKIYVCRTSSGAEEWRATLTGTFTYTGPSATCTAVSCSTSITDASWYEVSKTTSKSGATASGTVTMGEKFLGITINKETVNMSLTCDANGNLS